MLSLARILAVLLANHALLTTSHPTQAARAAAPPSEFTANPSIGGGGSQYKDSAHFRVYGVSSSVADQTLKFMEAAHECFVTSLGWRTPGLSFKSDSGSYYKMNIYKVDASAMPGAAAQTWTDANAGLAFLKVVDSYVSNPNVVVHEFGHAMTYSEKNWIDQTRTGAWWETIANFIADTYISTPACSAQKSKSNLPSGDSLIELKETISNSYKVLVDGTSGTGNYYQAWPFLAYITNNPDNVSGLGSQALQNMIRKYKLGSNETPLHSLERLVGSNWTIQKVVGRYWARMAYLDIGHAKAQQMFNSQKSSLNFANMDSNGNGKYTVKSARAPRYMGANIVPLKATGSSVSVAVTASGAYTATLAVKGSGGAVRYTDVVNGNGNVAVASGEEVSLVVVNTPGLVLYDPFSIPTDVNKGLSYSVQISGATL
ncbi:hypothetical protein BCR34DRAFT_589680 [Clohesyomyces aquaticus]|uniref:Dockerin type 1 n=1 Tax=Clohesyomyces aquaticus TaxID=1231657 RepID=A0A1Y1ZFJ9_9PLEO|nr:hypothetical protein BCR34DRAFT_589680 [Clohesyomyces aquaticus]